ncbi:MAG: DNA polymerase I [Legionellales bacterium]|nr:DNA polymerase I [Legionellales bacterium]
MTQNKPIILVDGSSYLYRAFHALPPLTNSHGEPTGAIYGVISMLKRLQKDYQPELMAVIFDPKGKTFRHDLFKDYKATRPPMPDDLRVQIEPVFSLIKALGFPLIIVDKVEADDVIGSFAHLALQDKREILISTTDKDMAQLVNDHIHLINTMSNKRYDRQAVIEKFGVPPELIVDYLALIGDKIDNVPGVNKCGPKTAVKWLQEFGDLNGIIANAKNIKGKVGEYLRESVEFLPLSKQLVTIHCTVDMPYQLNDLLVHPADTQTLKELFTRYEFKTWLKELTETTDAEKKSVSHHYHTIFTEEQLLPWLARLQQAPHFAFDIETTSLDYMQAELVGLSFAVTAEEAAYIPLAHNYENAPQQLNREKILTLLKPILEIPQKIIGQNIKYDMNILCRYGINISSLAGDTMLESYVLNSTSNRHDMDTLALHYLNYHTITFEEIAGKGAKQVTFNQVDIATATAYAAEDADITLRLHHVLHPKILAEEKLNHIYQTIELPLVPVLSRMECEGVLIDKTLLAQQSQTLAKRIKELEQQAFQLAKCEFNLGSPKQLQDILFTELKLPIIQKTPSGQPSTAENVLEELAYEYELPKVILEFRSLSKLKSTYTDRLPEQIDLKTGRVHTSYQQAVTSTGRLSSSNPNLQNIPIRHEAGRQIRRAFIARAEHVIVAADYSQIELRIMAHLSGDRGLLNAFAQGLDIHKATAAEVFGVPLNEVTSDQRRSAKAINFGLIYGMSAFGLAKQLGIDRNNAQEYMDLYFHRYPGVKQYMENTRQQAKQLGYVETISGRRLYLPEINSKQFQRQRAAERAAINAPMQGSAADIIKLAMIDIDRWIQREKIAAVMIMQVHDELVFEVHHHCVENVKHEIAERMSRALTLVVPLAVEVGVGANWDEAH